MRILLTLVISLSLSLAACGGSKKTAEKPGDKGGATGSNAGTAPAPAPDGDMAAKCCAQCLGGSSRDPAGMDISVNKCTKYHGELNGQMAVDDACNTWFETSGMTVGQCRDAAPKPE